MKRVLWVLTIVAMLAGPVALVVPSGADAANRIVIFTKERGSLKPALYACYTIADLTDSGTFNGGAGAGCDIDDGADGKTIVKLTGACDPCQVTQGLPKRPDNQPTDYLLEPSQKGSSSQTYTFKNFLKPYFVVTMIDVKTGNPFKGACIGLSQPDVPGSGSGICDGNPNGGDADQDGRVNGKIKTRRLPTPSQKPETLTYEVAGSTPGYTAKAVTEKAEPAKTGEFEEATLNFRKIR